ncbi:hypothetical protein PF011_g15394 [Phytophthora fragariae]|uniref:Uncharacterized protein n=1 Tax=Phytophthora fragariae TaxID=53985 RepID=A0A6A3JRA9_9STRA|nr:hypothetical protein PF011_g15394 [Phytophthora fragariae]
MVNKRTTSTWKNYTINTSSPTPTSPATPTARTAASRQAAKPHFRRPLPPPQLLQELAKGGSQETKQQEADKVKDNDSSCQLIASRYIPAMKYSILQSINSVTCIGRHHQQLGDCSS